MTMQRYPEGASNPRFEAVAQLMHALNEVNYDYGEGWAGVLGRAMCVNTEHVRNMAYEGRKTLGLDANGKRGRDPRPEVKQAVKVLKAAGFSLNMVTRSVQGSWRLLKGLYHGA